MQPSWWKLIWWFLKASQKWAKKSHGRDSLDLPFSLYESVLKQFILHYKTAGNSNLPCFKSTEYLLSPVTVICSLPSLFRNKNVKFVKNFGASPIVFNGHGIFVFCKSSKACFRSSDQSGSNFSISLSLENIVSPDTTLNIEFLFDKNRNL